VHVFLAVEDFGRLARGSRALRDAADSSPFFTHIALRT
jgi:hypothetical protein